MFGRGDYEFLGYLVQKTEDILLIFVPDDIPDVENTEEDDEGVYIKADMSRIQIDNEKDLERLEPGIMLMGLGRLTLQNEWLPEIDLNTLFVVR